MYSQKIELRHLRYFVVVAEELNFSRAAERLQMAQPPLSQQIRQLEQELGVQLLERNKHSVQLTEAGKVFLADAQRLLQQVEQAITNVQQAQRGQVGQLKIGFIATAADSIVPEVLKVYRARYPRVNVSLREMLGRDQLQALKDHELHVGFLVPPGASGMQPQISMEIVQRNPLVAVLPENHALAGKQSLAVNELAEEPFILYPHTSSSVFHDLIVGECNRAGFTPIVAQEVSEIRTLLGLVAAGLGVSLIPSTVTLFRPQGIVYLPLRDSTTDYTIAMTWQHNDSSSLVQEFLAVAREVIKQLQDRES
ncbi:LysR family transcriptional regulator [Dictyobacter alpinus]|uniref:LysR family transcriptional regulator n=1 Tax=Dictyobacter alpinus TaxID=2014873 RepID=A0A402BCK9_9CHLR|nr:LysR family transcriptional regulator [Dictyobacter alpinus]GCE29095.1 LysR family transcriptional regulator [Dictyobacter alpinus]